MAAFVDRAFGCTMGTAVWALVMEIGRWLAGGAEEQDTAMAGETSVGRGQVGKVGGQLRRIGRLGRVGRPVRIDPVRVFGETAGWNEEATGGSSTLVGGRPQAGNLDGHLRERAMDGSRIGVETVMPATAAATHSRDQDLLDLGRAITVSGTHEERIRGRLWRAARGEMHRASDQSAGRLMGAGLRTESLRGPIHHGSTDFRRTHRSTILRRRLRKRTSRNRTAEGIRPVGIRSTRIGDEALL